MYNRFAHLLLLSFAALPLLHAQKTEDTVEELNRTRALAVEGEVFIDGSTPGRAHITMVSAITASDMKRFYQANPNWAFNLVRYRGALSSCDFFRRWPFTGVGEAVEVEGELFRPTYFSWKGIRDHGRPHHMMVIYVRYQEQWYMIFNTYPEHWGGKGDPTGRGRDDWKSDLSAHFNILKAALPEPTRRELKELERYDGLLAKAVSGGRYSRQRTPADAFITLNSAMARNDLDLYRKVNPTHWQGLLMREEQLVPPDPEKYHAIWRVGPYTGNEEGASCPIYTIRGNPLTDKSVRLRNVEIFVFCLGKWRKACNTGIHDRDWLRRIPEQYQAMKRVIEVR